MYSEVKYESAGWSRQFAWMPKNCVFTKKVIWLKYGYTVLKRIPVTARMSQITGYPNIMQIRLWADADEFIILKLKGIIK